MDAVVLSGVCTVDGGATQGLDLREGGEGTSSQRQFWERRFDWKCLDGSLQVVSIKAAGRLVRLDCRRADPTFWLAEAWRWHVKLALLVDGLRSSD